MKNTFLKIKLFLLIGSGLALILSLLFWKSIRDENAAEEDMMQSMQEFLKTPPGLFLGAWKSTSKNLLAQELFFGQDEDTNVLILYNTPLRRSNPRDKEEEELRCLWEYSPSTEGLDQRLTVICPEKRPLVFDKITITNETLNLSSTHKAEHTYGGDYRREK